MIPKPPTYRGAITKLPHASQRWLQQQIMQGKQISHIMQDAHFETHAQGISHSMLSYYRMQLFSSDAMRVVLERPRRNKSNINPDCMSSMLLETLYTNLMDKLEKDQMSAASQAQMICRLLKLKETLNTRRHTPKHHENPDIQKISPEAFDAFLGISSVDDVPLNDPSSEAIPQNNEPNSDLHNHLNNDSNLDSNSDSNQTPNQTPNQPQTGHEAYKQP